MRLVLTSIILSTLVFVNSKAQTILDSEFKWIKSEYCIPKTISKEVFVKAEEDPSISQFSKTEFDKLIGKIFEESNLAENINGIIKLKILFAKGHNLCVTQIGTKSIVLSAGLIDRITKTIQEINEFKCGQQRNIEVYCQGFLYVNITNGKVTGTRNVNFTF